MDWAGRINVVWASQMTFCPIFVPLSRKYAGGLNLGAESP